MKWPRQTFDDVFEIQLGKMLDKKKNRGDLFPYLANRNVQWGRCDVSSLEKMRFTDVDQVRFSLKRGDLLVCEGGEVGRTAVWAGEVENCFYQKAIHRLRPKASVESRFVLRYMRWAADRKLFARLTSSTSIAHLTKAKLKQVPIPLPPLDEQRRIAAILDAADALRVKRRASLVQLDTLLQSTFLEMFGDPVVNPMSWNIKNIEETGSMVQIGPFGSLLHKEDYVSGGVPLVNPKHIVRGAIVVGRGETVTRAKAEQLNGYRLQAGDVIMGRRGEMGRCAVITNDTTGMLCGTGSLFIRPNPKIFTTLYLSKVMSSASIKAKLERIAWGVTMANLNRSKIASLEIPLPPLDLQRKFASIVESVEKQKERQRAHLAELDTLFASLQQRAFRGDL